MGNIVKTINTTQKSIRSILNLDTIWNETGYKLSLTSIRKKFKKSLPKQMPPYTSPDQYLLIFSLLIFLDQLKNYDVEFSLEDLEIIFISTCMMNFGKTNLKFSKRQSDEFKDFLCLLGHGGKNV